MPLAGEEQAGVMEGKRECRSGSCTMTSSPESFRGEEEYAGSYGYERDI